MTASTAKYSTYIAAMTNALAIGNQAAALLFEAKAASCKFIEPPDWRPHVCATRGIPLHGRTLTHTKTFATKASAVDGAKSIGWPAGAVTKVHHRIHGEKWAIVDGRFGLLSRSWFNSASEAR